MDSIKSWLKEHKILPRISFKDRQEHKVEIVKAKEESFHNAEDELVEGVKFLVKEGNEAKTFFTASQDLLLKLADCREGDVYKIKMVAKNVGGVIKTSYDVKQIKEGKEVEEDIPVIDEEPTQEELDKIFPDR
jgi:hypothetical protein